MKKRIVFIAVSSILFISGFSQSNNPYDAEGIAALKNALYMRQQLKDGNVVSTDQKVIQKYNDVLKIGPLNTVTDITIKTFQTVTAQGFNITGYINNSGLPASLKKEILNMNAAATVYTVNDYRKYLSRKVDSLKAARDLNEGEKNSLLKLCSVYYHMTEADTKNTNNKNDGPYAGREPHTIYGPGATVLGCTAAGYAVGYVAGLIFGATEVGGAIGAGVGFIVGLCIEIS